MLESNKYAILIVFGCLSGNLPVSAQVFTQSPATPDKSPAQQFSHDSMSQALASISQNSGIAFDLPELLKQQKLNFSPASMHWRHSLQQLRKQYNHVGFLNDQGQLQLIIFLNRHYSADSTDNVVSPLFDYPENTGIAPLAKKSRPQHLQHLPTQAVLPISINRQHLENMQKGETLVLHLPTGTYEVAYQQNSRHANGDFTWVGQMQNATTGENVLITLGDNATYGRIVTQQGNFQIESDGKDLWLIDVHASDLQAVNNGDDALMPDTFFGTVAPPRKPSAEKPGMRKKPPLQQPGQQQSKAKSPEHTSEISVMVLYPASIDSEAALATRINYLLELSNRAYQDSQVDIQLQLARLMPVAVEQATENSAILQRMTRGVGEFADIAQARNQSAADLVSYLHPYNAQNQENCGVAWLGGSNGRRLNARFAYSVVNYGMDQGVYCSDYSLVHEISHNMGAAHDRTHALNNGKFSYSYGYGSPTLFGTIMSYFEPQIGLFSNPRLQQCAGLTCGVPADQPDAADNARTLDQTRAAVAAFRK